MVPPACGVLTGCARRNGTPEQFGELIAADTSRWARVVRAAGIKVD